jgi:hypothetical protein
MRILPSGVWIRFQGEGQRCRSKFNEKSIHNRQTRWEGLNMVCMELQGAHEAYEAGAMMCHSHPHDNLKSRTVVQNLNLALRLTDFQGVGQRAAVLRRVGG